jgi:hypothetical protein
MENIKLYAGFFLDNNEHITWEFAPGKCSLPEGVGSGDEVEFNMVGFYKDSQVHCTIVEVYVGGECYTHQPGGTLLHITHRSDGVPPVEAGTRATKNGYEPFLDDTAGLEYPAIAGYFEVPDKNSK